MDQTQTAQSNETKLPVVQTGETNVNGKCRYQRALEELVDAIKDAPGGHYDPRDRGFDGPFTRAKQVLEV